MRGKPIDQIVLSDLHQLIADGVPEGRRLEYKSDLPVSPEEQKAHRKLDPTARPVERSWIEQRPLARYGRDELAAEVVAFANADGGTLILGVEETEDKPPRASTINPLPDVMGLERRLRDALIDTVEPRLPYVAVRAVATDDAGSGVVVIETAPSALGPHWVRTSRRATVRREDRCDPLSMSEIHEMVLRRARASDEVRQRISSYRAAFTQAFAAFVARKIPTNFLGEDKGEVARVWLRSSGQAALGAQVILVPHADLAIPRLETLHGLLPGAEAIGIVRGPDIERTSFVDTYRYAAENHEKVLGGVHARQNGGFEKSVRVMREGHVVVSFMQIRELQRCTCSADLIAGACGAAIGIFDRLRKRSTYPSTPADITLDICTRGRVGVGAYRDTMDSSYGQLEEHTTFPIYSIGDSQDIPVLLNEIAADLMNAGGMPASLLPKIAWDDPE